MRFKVGDKVIIHKPICTVGVSPSWVSEMDKYDARIVTLESQNPSGSWKIKEDFWSFSENWMELVRGKDMEKRNLGDGDVVELRNGEICVVFHDYLFEKEGSRVSLDPFREDLTNGGCIGKKFDIMKVCKKPPFPFDFYNEKPALILWDWVRKEAKEVTMAEVEEKFGCKVKIIKGENE